MDMADSAVGFLVGKLGELLSTKLTQIRGVDKNILSLSKRLVSMQALLKDIDARRRDNERIKVLVDQIRDVTFQAEDAIDRFIYEVQCRRHTGFVGSMKNFVSQAGSLKVRNQLARKIEEIEKELQEILDSASKYGIELKESPGETSSTNSNLQWLQSRALATDLEEMKVIGFDDHIATLVNQLTNDKQGDVVVPIVGMGGLGKTTLARSICNHADINRHFECQVWVSVSQKYRRRDLLKSMLEDLLKPPTEKSKIPGKKEETEQFNRDELEKMTEIDMENKLKGHLQGKRYLLVIDDIWDREAWNYIRRALPNEKNGSGIILSTRNEDVAKCVHPSATPYKINTLVEADGWKLLCSKVFETNEGISEELEELGMKMVRKCGGLPLAITVLGGFLSRKPKSDIEWRKVLNRITHELHERDDDQNVRRILALSYDDLPHYLRYCFLYLGLFPEDSKIDVKNLIQLWVAEGFIQARGEQTMEEVAEDYVGELVDRCMIQVVKRNSWGGVDSCRVHDFLLDLSITQGKEDKFLDILAGSLTANHTHLAASPRRAAIHCRSISECMPPTHGSSPSSLRSLLCFNTEAKLPQVRLLVNNLKLLRVLDLKGTKIQRLPKQIGGMVHLRYLGLEVVLEEFGIFELPSSVGKLRNLQTLRLRACLIPDSVCKIETLRHITGVILFFQRGILHSNFKGDLQTLWGINAGNWVGTALGDFTNLRALWIHRILATHVEGLSASLKKLTRLNTLILDSIGAPTMVQTVLGVLKNHPVLYELAFIEEKCEKHLCRPLACTVGVVIGCIKFPNLNCTTFPCIMSSYMGAKSGQKWQPPQFQGNHQFPASLTRLQVGIAALFSTREGFASLESLPNLKFLNLFQNAYIMKEMIFSPRTFTKLQELQLCELEELEQLTIHDAAMPCLKRLMIYKCPMLKSLPEGLQHINTLHQLEIESMPPEFTQKIQKEGGEEWYKVQNIPSITIE